MTDKELRENGWEPQLCKIGRMYFKDGFFCRFKQESSEVSVFSIKDDMLPLGCANTIDEIEDLKKNYLKRQIKFQKEKYMQMMELYENLYNEKYTEE